MDICESLITFNGGQMSCQSQVYSWLWVAAAMPAHGSCIKTNG